MIKLTREELKKAGWKSNEEREKALKSIAKDFAKYLMNTSPAFQIREIDKDVNAEKFNKVAKK